MGSSLSCAAAKAEPSIVTIVGRARDGDVDALLKLGRMCSSGSRGSAFDLIEAHKWFNLAASRGCEHAPNARVDIAAEMSARQISAAQRAARAFLREA